MKKNGLLALLLALALVLCACGGSSEARDDGAYQYNGAVTETWASTESKGEEPESAGGITGSTLDAYSDPNAKLIRTVYMDAQTREDDAVLTGLDAKIKELGGYVENRDAYNGSEYYGRSNRYVDMMIRIPADRLDEFVTHVDESCNVTNTTERVENITLEYTDTAARVQALETEQQRLLELLEEAQNLTEILEIEARLSDVGYELNSYASQLRVMDNMVSYATIHLNIQEVEKLTPVEKPTVWQRISEGFQESLEDVYDGLVDFVVWLLANSPRIALWAVILAILIPVWRFVFRRRNKEKKTWKFGRNKKAEENPQNEQSE